MSLYNALTDLARQVANVLSPRHGGTGSTYGEQRTVLPMLNSTGGTLPLYTLVEPTFGANDTRIQAVTVANSKTVLGAVVGYYKGGALVEADCPDGYEAAVQTSGMARVLIESTVTRADYAYSAATDGTMASSSSGGQGAFGLVLTSADVSAGQTWAWVLMPATGAPTPAGGSYGTPALTLSTTNAAGSGTTGIRTNATIAAFDATAPVTQAFGDAAATGSAGVAARRDHKHGMPSSPSVPAQGTPGLTLGTSNAAGSSGAYVGTDATIAAFDATAPVTQALGDSAAAGSAGVAARRDHKHGMPSFATPAIVLGSAAAAGSAATPIRSDSTIAAFDTTAPTTQAPSDAATVGTAAFAARRDHKHGWPAFGTGASDIAVGNHTHGGAGAGVWDSVVTKSADESVTSSTALQDDDELFVAGMVSGGFYQFEAHIFHDAGAGGSATDIKFSFGEDNTFRGYMTRIAGNAGTGTSEIVAGSIQQNQPLTAQTGNGSFGLLAVGNWVSGGSTFKLQWAQNNSNATALKVKAGSTLKVKRLN